MPAGDARPASAIWALLRAKVRELYAEAPKVRLMTGHASKGLEADDIFLLSLSQLPSPRAIELQETYGCASHDSYDFRV